ncbi:MAG: T9SS type A sorting domain-containing protein [Bacteroidota bacterium]|nr:T9SS type A sorting domain-containing protein [Bacteroidota bacterium]
MTKHILFTFYIVSLFANIQAQCMLQELSIKEKAQKSELVVEARVMEKISYWNNAQTRIYTLNKLEIYKLFKGQINPSEINLITEGGTIENIKHSVQHALDLKPGDTGLFFIQKSENNELKNNKISNDIQFLAFGAVQGYIKYDEQVKSASDPFNYYSDITVELYSQITSLTGKYKVYKQLEFKTSQDTKSTVFIDDFNPKTLPGGTEKELTILGNGFGNIQGETSYVEFKDANAGGFSYYQPLASQYILWEDGKIIVKVPSRAGTGTFRVRNGNATIESIDSLTISYSHLNALINGNAFQINLIDKNSNGGYLWQMNKDFSNNKKAAEAFERAFNTWRCETFIKWELGNSTDINTIASDGVNLIRFDNGAELPAGVLGACYTYWNGCGSAENMRWFVNELDIVFNDSTNWSFTSAAPKPNTFDLESIALHELGHGHQLGHVINPNGVMHYAVAAGEAKKNLDYNDNKGGNYIIKASMSNTPCGNSPITIFNSSDCSVSSDLASINIEISNGTNPSCENTPITFTAHAQNGGLFPLYKWEINKNSMGTNDSTFTSSNLKNNDKVTCSIISSKAGISGSMSTSKDLIMSISSKPFTEVLPLGTDSLTSSIEGKTYQWYYNSLVIEETKKSIKPLLTGTYTVSVIDYYDCISDESPAFLYNPLGINKLEKTVHLNIFPNPSSGIFTVQVDEINYNDNEISVSNLLGQIIYSGSFTNVNKKEINLTSYSEGIYFLLIRTGKKIAVEKIILQEEVD